LRDDFAAEGTIAWFYDFRLISAHVLLARDPIRRRYRRRRKPKDKSMVFQNFGIRLTH